MSDVPERIAVTEDGLDLPVIELLTGRGFVTGKSGSGKSNTASVIAEELLEAGVPVLVVDADGEYYGLKEEYELLHAGADQECDVQVGVEHAEKLASLALEESVPVVLDVSGYRDRDDARELVTEVIDALFVAEKRVKKPFLVVVEEVHEFIPETGGLDEVGEVIVRVAKRGRKRGLGLCGISQRPASVDKDFITQCDWMVWHRLTWDNDTRVVSQILGSDAATTVTDLDDGEALLMTDWDEQTRRVRFRRKRTFDAGATPGLDDVDRPNLKSVSDHLVEKLAAVDDADDADGDPADDGPSVEEKERRIAELEAELADATSRNAANAETDAGDDGAAANGGVPATREPPEATEPAADATRTDSGSTDRTREPPEPPTDDGLVAALWEFGQLTTYVLSELSRRAHAAVRSVRTPSESGPGTDRPARPDGRDPLANERAYRTDAATTDGGDPERGWWAALPVSATTVWLLVGALLVGLAAGFLLGA